MGRFLWITWIFVANLSFAQDRNNISSATVSSLANYFLGTWHSDPKACVGMGEATREYKWILDSAFFYASTVAKFESEGKVDDIHKDWSILSYDNESNTLNLREFHSEGYVIKYINRSMSQALDTIIFVSDLVENTPQGWKARLTINIIDDRSFDEFFDLAEPGSEFKNYVKGRWIRK